MYLVDKSHIKQSAQQHNFFYKARSNSGIMFYDIMQDALSYESLLIFEVC